MKLKNELIVIGLILFILISISAVSAENNQTEIILQNDNDYDELNVNNDEILKESSDGSFTDLNDTINGATSDNIELDRNYAYSNTDTIENGILINKNNLTIDGKGHTIDAGGKSRILYVNSTSLTLKNIKFVNGFHKSLGGAIYNYGENLRVINCTFENNHVKNDEGSSWGGAIYSYPDSYTCFVNSRFINNSADYGGAVVMRGSGEGFRHDILYCAFINNTADEAGAVMGYGKWGTVENIKGCLFVNNDAENGTAYYNILAGHANITDSIFLNQSGVVIESWSRNTIANNNWFGNDANNKSARPNVGSDVEMESWLYFDLAVNIDKSTVTVSINNAYNETSQKSEKHTTKILPSINAHIEAVNATLALNDIVLDNSGESSVHYDLYGDCEVTATFGDISISKKFNSGSFMELQALIDNAESGDTVVLDKDYVYTLGIDTSVSGVEVLKDIVIDGNGHFVNAAGKSRVFYVNSHHVTFKNIIIINGNARYADGAGIESVGNYNKFINCTFTDNFADGDNGGGALFIYGHLNTIVDCTFKNNVHDYILGGAVYSTGYNTTISNTVFDSNSARTRGGALVVDHACTLTNCIFINNSADYAGAIYESNYDDDQSIIDNCTFMANCALTQDASYGGGAIISKNAYITNSVFLNNSALAGGALFSETQKNTVDKCVFINNTGRMGIICWIYGGTVINSIFLENDCYNIIENPWEGVIADYNWFGNVWKDYTVRPDVTTLATMNHWLFLNVTDMLYDNETGELDFIFDFFIYDSENQVTLEYDYLNLPSITLKLSSQNLTLNKDVVSIGENIHGLTTYYAGNLFAEYENVRYTMPFKFKMQSWIEVNSTFDVEVTKSKTISFDIHPFSSEYQLFLQKRITYISSNTSIFKVDSNGKITGVGVGLANLTIIYNGLNAVGDDKYTPSSAVVVVNVTRIATHIELIYSIDNVTVGNTALIKGSLKPSSGYLTYTSNDTSVATVTGDIVKGIREGVVNITISYEGNSKYAPSSTSVIVKVLKTPTSISLLSSEDLQIDKGRQYSLGYILYPSNAGLVECISNDTNVAYYDDNGVVHGINVGVANLTFVFKGNDKFASSSASILVTVVDYDTHFDVEPQITINATQSQSLNADLKDSNDNLIIPPPIYLIYTSNDTSVVSVDDNGRITAIREGKANITINFTGYDKYNPSLASVIVEVKSVETSINVEIEKELEVGDYKNINAKLNHGDSNQLVYASNDTDIVSVSSRGYLNAKHVGVAEITITYAGNEAYKPCNATVIVKVSYVQTTIEVGKTFSLLVNQEENLNATLKPNGGKLIYTSNDTSIVTVDTNGNIRAIGEGTATITIRYAGTDKYAEAHENVVVSVYSTSIPTAIEVAENIELYAGNVTNLNATLNPSNAGKLNYTSNDTSVVVVGENGELTAVGKGIAKITVTLEPNDNFNPASTSVIVNVLAAPTGFEADSEITVNLTENKTVEYVFSHPQAGEIEFIIDNPTIINIENGVIIGKKLGETTLTLKFNGNNQYAPSQKQITVKVVDVEVTIDAPDSVEVNLTESVSIGDVLSPLEAGNVIYSSSNDTIASVDSNGVITGVKVGEADITITFEANGKYRATSKTVHVTVSDVEVTITAPDSVEVNLTESVSIGDVLSPLEAGNVIYSSSNDTIVSVDSNGVITAVKAGEADITITFEANGKYRAASKTVHVIVKTVKTEIEVENDNIQLQIDDVSYINATVNADGDAKLSYKSNDSTIVSIDEKGVMTALKQGTAQITITYDGEGKYEACNKTVTVTVSRIPTEIRMNNELTVEIGLGFKINPVLSPSVSKDFIIDTNDTSILEIDSSRMYIYTLAYGVALVTISYEGNEKYLPSQTNVTITVNPRITEISVDNYIEIGYGDLKNINAKVLHSGNMVDSSLMEGAKLLYESKNPDVVSIDENGVMTTKKRGTAEIFIKYEGTNVYYPSNTTVLVNVTEMTTEITLDQSKVYLKVDDNHTITAVLTRPDDGVVTFKSGNESVARVDENGKITAVGAGDAIITVGYEGNENYHSSNATVSVHVSKIDSSIRVNNTFTMLIDDTHDIEAKLSHDGKLIYESSNENVAVVDKNGVITAIGSGSAMITVTFESDYKYEHVKRTVTVNVHKIPTSINLDPITLYVTNQYQIPNPLNPANAGELDYESNDWDIFGVDSDGLISGFMEGSADLTVNFWGNDKYLPSSKNVVVTVIKNYISSNDYQFTTEIIDELNQAKFSVRLPADAEGMFSVEINGDTYASPIVDGMATITVDDLSVGTFTATMRYSGDEYYAGITNNARVHVAEIRMDKNTDISILSSTAGKYSVHLTADTQALEGKTVTFTLNGKKIYATTDNRGYATIKVKLSKSKTYTVTAEYGNVKVTNKVKVISLIVAKNIKVKKSASSTKIKVSLKKLNGKYLKAKKLILKFNGKKYKAKTNKKGVANFSLKKSVFAKLKVGKKYKYTVSYSKDSVTKKITIKK